MIWPVAEGYRGRDRDTVAHVGQHLGPCNSYRAEVCCRTKLKRMDLQRSPQSSFSVAKKSVVHLIRRVQLGAMLRRKGHVGEHIGLGLIEQASKLGQLGTELISDLPPLRRCSAPPNGGLQINGLDTRILSNESCSSAALAAWSANRPRKATRGHPSLPRRVAQLHDLGKFGGYARTNHCPGATGSAPLPVAGAVRDLLACFVPPCPIEDL